MKRVLLRNLVSVMLVLVLSLPAFAAPEIKDVSAGHWAYAAIQKLLDKGYLSLYQDGTFRGELPVDRYTFAVVTARLISEMSATQQQDTASKKQELTQEDLEVMRKLTTEFRDELVQLATVDEELRKELQSAAKESTVLREDLNKLLVQVYQLQQSTKALAEQDQDLISRLDALQAQSEGNSGEIARLDAGLKEATTGIDGLRDDLSNLELKIDEEVLTRTSGTYVRQQSMDKQLQALSQEFESYRRSTETELEDLRSKNQMLTMGIIGSLLLGLVIK